MDEWNFGSFHGGQKSLTHCLMNIQIRTHDPSIATWNLQILNDRHTWPNIANNLRQNLRKCSDVKFTFNWGSIFANFGLIKRVSPSSSTVRNTFFHLIISWHAPLWRTWFTTQLIYYGVGKERRKKAQHPAGIEPTSSWVSLARRMLYQCTTTAAHPYKSAITLKARALKWSW